MDKDFILTNGVSVAVADSRGEKIEIGQKVAFFNMTTQTQHIGKVEQAFAKLSIPRLQAKKEELDYYRTNNDSSVYHLEVLADWKVRVREIGTGKTFSIAGPAFITVIEDSVLFANHL